ncbi:MAG: CRISPR-associated endoribonuclease Cas6 [Candidatus Wallbacteria bacterium]|nr:CRISPR-associated endoribonuclease Cas6 [Candidatus Wallbacteria bacterium]
MRIKLTLSTLIPASIPINYNYFITAMIYRFLAASSQEFSAFLHDYGYRLSGSRKGFKLFTYSMLRGHHTITGALISFTGPVTLLLSSPVMPFVQHLVNGLFSRGANLEIGPSTGRGRFRIESVETLENPKFTRKMKFVCLSPATVSVSGDNGLPHYLRPWEEGFSDAIKHNLMRKYELVHGKKLRDSAFEVRIDNDYMNRHAGKVMKTIAFKKAKIAGYFAPFTVTGSPKLLELGYEAGFGEKGSMGFGMVEAVR